MDLKKSFGPFFSLVKFTSNPIFRDLLTIESSKKILDIFYLEKPFFDSSLSFGRVYVGAELDSLLFAAKHGMNVELGVELEFGNALEAFLQMRLNSCGIFGLGQNVEHLVVGEKEKAREEETLLFEIGIEAFVDFLDQMVAVSQLVQHAAQTSRYQNLIHPKTDKKFQ